MEGINIRALAVRKHPGQAHADQLEGDFHSQGDAAGCYLQLIGQDPGRETRRVELQSHARWSRSGRCRRSQPRDCFAQRPIRASAWIRNGE